MLHNNTKAIHYTISVTHSAVTFRICEKMRKEVEHKNLNELKE